MTTTPPPAALGIGKWTIMIRNADVVSFGFVAGDPVVITDQKQVTSTPGVQWEHNIQDTVYRIEKWARVPNNTVLKSPVDWANFLPHSMLSLTLRGIPSNEPYATSAKVYLLKEYNYRASGVSHTILKGTRVSIIDGPLSRVGTNTSKRREASAWNYQVQWVLEGWKSEKVKYPHQIPASYLDTTAIAAVKEPKY